MKHVVFTFLLIPVLVSCSLDDSSNRQQDEFEQLQITRSSIEQVAKSIPCADDNQCKAVAFGSKPCGGPWTYLAYNDGIDEEAFLEMVANFNAAEDAYNLKWGIVSDCMVVGPPTSVECIDGVCTTVY
jgi:hypothetical protein